MQTELLDSIPEEAEWDLKKDHYDIIVEEFVDSGNYFKAERRGKRLSKILDTADDKIIIRALDGIKSNNQIYRAGIAKPYVSAVFHEAAKDNRNLSDEVDEALKSLLGEQSLRYVESMLNEAPKGVSEDLVSRAQDLNEEKLGTDSVS